MVIVLRLAELPQRTLIEDNGRSFPIIDTMNGCRASRQRTRLAHLSLHFAISRIYSEA
jgi:hypothetical protein